MNEAIEGNSSLFLAYNSKRREQLFTQIGAEKAEMLQTIPFLLHVNKPGIPGYIDHPLVIFGIYDVKDTFFWNFSLDHFNLKEKAMGPWLSRKFHIRGLYLMGNTGMVTRKMPLDLNYWLIIDKKKCSGKQASLLKWKVEEIQSWCLEKYGYKILFSIIDISDFRDNNFSSISDDIPGSIQRTLLKEEFYRTYIFIAGKIPFWTVCPSGTDDYPPKKVLLSSDKKEDSESRYIDLGPVSHIEKKECPDAALWQIYKARNNPAEALIKAALIASYNFSEKGASLPCDKLKGKIEQNRGEQSVAAPNIIVFQAILAFAETVGNSALSEAIKESIYLSLSGYPSAHREPDELPGGPINGYLDLWNWTPQKLDHFRVYEQWLEQDMVLYEQKLIRQIAFVYELVLRSQEESEDEVKMPKCDNRSLYKAITDFFKKKSERIPSISTYFKTCSGTKNIGLYCENNKNGEEEWSVYESSAKHTIKTYRFLYKGPELLKVIGWIITNGIFTGDFKRISFHQPSGPLDTGIIKKLTQDVFKFLNSGAEPAAISENPVWNKIVAVLIPDDKHTQNSLLHAEVLLCNSWHEIYYNRIEFDRRANLSARYCKIAEYIVKFTAGDDADTLKYQIIKPANDKSQDQVRIIENFIKTLSNKKGADDNMLTMEDGEEEDSDEIKPFLDVL